MDYIIQKLISYLRKISKLCNPKPNHKFGNRLPDYVIHKINYSSVFLQKNIFLNTKTYGVDTRTYGDARRSDLESEQNRVIMQVGLPRHLTCIIINILI